MNKLKFLGGFITLVGALYVVIMSIPITRAVLCIGILFHAFGIYFCMKGIKIMVEALIINDEKPNRNNKRSSRYN